MRHMIWSSQRWDHPWGQPRQPPQSQAQKVYSSSSEDSSDNEDAETGHWKSKNKYQEDEDEDMSRPWRRQKVDAFTRRISNFSEFSLVYGTEAVIPAEIGMPTIRTAEVNIATNDDERRIDLDILEERREQAAIREEKTKLKMKGYYDAKVRGVSFRPGDFVYRANDASHAEDTGKLGGTA
ncbi:hypothetical protein Tco_0660970 [Tanacetum coccineum]